MVRIYTYEKCESCRKALKFLAARGVAAVVVPIREHPPTEAELKQMLALLGGDIRRLFNTSGQDYKALKLKDKLPALAEPEALELLSKRGNLVKRPFMVTEGGGTVGFKEEEWRKLFPSQWVRRGT